MSIGSFIIIKNEAPWIAGHLLSWLPWLDQMVFFDGNSTDGTLEIIRDIKKRHAKGYKIVLKTGKDCRDLQEDYVRLFNECMWTLETDWAFFLHPDMLLASGGVKLREAAARTDAPAMFTHMESFAGEPGGDLFKITQGRGELWKNIYRLRNPYLGAHYHGFYGAQNEDVYFTEITGDEHDHHGTDLGKYPYEVADSGARVLHYSDVRDRARREGRMKSCLRNQGYSPDQVESLAKIHPRVTLKNGLGFKFEKAEYPADFLKAQREYEAVAR